MIAKKIISLSLLWSAIDALAFKRDDNSFKYVSGPFFAPHGGSKMPAIEFTIGTPPQKVIGRLDTGSDMGYINIGTYEGLPPFDPKKSSTYHNTTVLADNYFSGTNPSYWSYDTASWGSLAIKNYTFASTNSLENTSLIGTDPFYGTPNILTSLKEGGAISNRSFALYYSDPSNFSGDYVFGGIDYSKFIGKLTQLPYKHLFKSSNYSVLQGDDVLYVDRHNGYDIMFDSGGVNSYISPAAYKYLLDNYGDGKSLDCQKIREKKPKFQLEVGGVRNFTIDVVNSLPEKDCSTTDGLTAISTDQRVPHPPDLWKDTYVVWDYDNRRMLFGDRNPNPGKTDIRPITEDVISN